MVPLIGEQMVGALRGRWRRFGNNRVAARRGVLTSGARVEVPMAAGTGKSFVGGAIDDAGATLTSTRYRLGSDGASRASRTSRPSSAVANASRCSRYALAVW